MGCEYFDPIKEGPVKGPLQRLKDTLMWLCKELQKTEVSLEKTELWYVKDREKHQKDRKTLMELIAMYREDIETLEQFGLNNESP